MKKLSAIALTLILFAGCFITTHAVTVSQITEAALGFIIPNEGVYDTVLANDNGALSIGRIGWHGTLALNVIQKVAAKNESQAKEYLGDALYNEVKTAGNWDHRTLSTSERDAIQKLLATSQSKTVQDQECRALVGQYVELAQRNGMTDPRAIVYFCDMHNQYGGSVALSIARRAAELAGSYSAITLDIYYKATMEKYTYYRSRRESCYNYCKTLTFDGYTPVGNLGDLDGDGNVTARDARTALMASASMVTLTSAQKQQADVDGDGTVTARDARRILRVSARLETFDNPSGNTNTYTTTAEHGLTLRSGPGTNYSVVGNQYLPFGTRISVSQKSNGWGKITYNGYSGWVSLEFCRAA